MVGGRDGGVRSRGVGRGTAGRVKGAEHVGGMGGFVAPDRELVLKVGETEVGEGGVHAVELRRAAGECQARRAWLRGGSLGRVGA